MSFIIRHRLDFRSFLRIYRWLATTLSVPNDPVIRDSVFTGFWGGRKALGYSLQSKKMDKSTCIVYHESYWCAFSCPFTPLGHPENRSLCEVIYITVPHPSLSHLCSAVCATWGLMLCNSAGSSKSRAHLNLYLLLSAVWPLACRRMRKRCHVG